MKTTLDIEQHGSGVTLLPGGDWSTATVRQARRLLRRLALPNGEARLSGERLKRLDTAGAWQLMTLIHHWEEQGVSYRAEDFSDDHRKILELIHRVKSLPTEEASLPHGFHYQMESLGRISVDLAREAYTLVAFFGQVALSLWYVLRHPQHFRLRSTVFHIYQVGLQAIPIISLLAFLIAIVLGYQGIEQLRKFNAQAFTIDASVLSILREMGVLLTSIMVAGRSGSAFTAAIGVMKMNQEVDAMRTLGLDPFEVLVLPRLLAILIALPLLTFVADVVGVLGTFVVAHGMLDIGWHQFFARLSNSVQLHTFVVGIVKAPVFALLIGTVGCLRGMKVQGAAEEVGRQTTVSVVHSIFLILLADAIFSIIFTILKV